MSGKYLLWRLWRTLSIPFAVRARLSHTKKQFTQHVFFSTSWQWGLIVQNSSWKFFFLTKGKEYESISRMLYFRGHALGRSFPKGHSPVSPLRIISHVISERALENGGFFFTAGPCQRGKSKTSMVTYNFFLLFWIELYISLCRINMTQFSFSL